MDDEEYQRRQDDRLNNDFIVDDDGYGYKDYGGEVWEGEKAIDKRSKKRKLDEN